MMESTDSLWSGKRFAVVLAVVVVSVIVAGGAAATDTKTGDVTGEIAPAAAALSDTDTQAQTAGSTTVQLTPTTTTTVAAGDFQEYNIVVSDTEGGVGAITATISVGDTDIGSIGDVELNGNPGVETVDIESDGSEAFVRAALMDTDDSGAVTVGTVTVEGTGQGSSDISMDIESLGNEGGEPYNVGATPGSSFTVEGSADAVPLDISADESIVEPGNRVNFEVRRGDGDALVSATVHVDGESFETGIDGVATVRITDEMGSDAGTITAIASKEATGQESFRNDSVTLDVGDEETGTPAEPETPDGTKTPEPEDGPRVTLQPASPSVGVGEETEWRLVATGVDGSIGAVEAQVRLESTETAKITNVELAGDAGLEQTEIQEDGASAVISGAMMDTNNTGVSHIATLTVEGVDSGTTNAVVSVDSLGDVDGNSYDIGSSPSARLSVGSGDDDGNSTVVLSVSEMPNGFERASVTVRTAVDASVTDTQGELVSDSQLRVVSNGPRSTTVQAVDLAGNVDAFQESRTIMELTYDQRVSTEDVEIEVENLQNDNGASVSSDRISVEVQAGGLFEEALQGADTGVPPTDPDGDNLYEDINGDGEVSFDDAVALSFVDATELGTEQVAALDFDDDGDLDIDDAVALAFE